MTSGFFSRKSRRKSWLGSLEEAGCRSGLLAVLLEGALRERSYADGEREAWCREKAEEAERASHEH